MPADADALISLTAEESQRHRRFRRFAALFRFAARYSPSRRAITDIDFFIYHYAARQYRHFHAASRFTQFSFSSSVFLSYEVAAPIADATT